MTDSSYQGENPFPPADAVEVYAELVRQPDFEHDFWPIAHLRPTSLLRRIALLRTGRTKIAQPLDVNQPGESRRLRLTSIMISGLKDMFEGPGKPNCHEAAIKLTQASGYWPNAGYPPRHLPEALPRDYVLPLGQQALIGWQSGGRVVISHSIVGLGDPIGDAAPECIHRPGSADPIGISQIADVLRHYDSSYKTEVQMYLPDFSPIYRN